MAGPALRFTQKSKALTYFVFFQREHQGMKSAGFAQIFPFNRFRKSVAGNQPDLGHHDLQAPDRFDPGAIRTDRVAVKKQPDGVPGSPQCRSLGSIAHNFDGATEIARRTLQNP